MLAGRPDEPIEVPGPVRALAEGGTATAVWRNLFGTITFDVVTDEQRRFAKWSPRGNGEPLRAEAERMRWLAPFVPVPEVRSIEEHDDGTLFVTNALVGVNAIDERWTHDPAPAVRAVGRGLRILHDRAPVDACPFTWSIEARTTLAVERLDRGLTVPDDWHEEHCDLPLDAVRTLLRHPPPVDRLVVCHGDACAPNTIVDDDGAFVGLVDLAAVGVTDRWADLAIATWSVTWNHGPGWETLLLDAYGIEADATRIAYHRLLWDLT